ncbi:chromosome segregation protein SMC [Bryobacter aggregatus]|uniref:chromosome segregation protein SMC n=1 Tax=Bryobacter aggregatus TaxID=360054 RepID=UPI0009B5B83A|nr:chromosome segregation protein SMC [Bryobacter aggregatus]
MLKLKRLELQGFKSFCDRTEMRFPGEGVAAIVGPNGCGKSNLSDAISWVLGEQSAKSLRGGRMEDVIFAGTRDRKPLGMASVTMTMVDPDGSYLEKVLPSEKPENVDPEAPPKPKTSREITITRRLYRSGDSEYLIDGKLARLRDIQDVFMGSGLGPESYAIIEQGRIGQILSNKPMDRRSIIEEAAGITKFKTRRRLAESRLESARQNLNRVFDILEEVGRQVNSLKRQAAKAKRYDELKTELDTHIKLVLSNRFRYLEREATKVALELNESTNAYTELATNLSTKDADQQKLQARFYEIESALTASRKQLAELRLEAERTRGRLGSQSQQIANIDQRLTQNEGEVTSLEARLTELKTEFEAAQKESAELEQQAVQLRAQVAEKTSQRDTMSQQLRERSSQLERNRQQVFSLLGEVNRLRNQLTQVETQQQGVTKNTERSTREETEAQAESERLELVRAELSEKLNARQMTLEGLADRRKYIETELNTRRQEVNDTRRQQDILRTETSRLKARRDSLEDIINHRSYTTDSVKKLFTAIGKGQATGLKPMGVLADFIEVDASYEKAAEEFLVEELEYVVVEQWNDAQRGITLMKQDLEGRATFLVHPAPEANFSRGRVQEPPVGPETGIVGRLSDVLKMTNGFKYAPAELLPRVTRCFLAQDHQAAQRLALQYPDVYFLLPDGVCYHGYAVTGGKKSSSGPLALKRELKELNAQHHVKQLELEQSNTRLQQLEGEQTALAADLEKLRQEQQQEEKGALVLDQEQRQLATDLQRSARFLSNARVELDRLANEAKRLAALRETLETGSAEKDAARVALEAALEAERGALVELQQQFNSMNEEHSTLRAQLASVDERLRSANGAVQRLNNSLIEQGRRREYLSSEMERLGVNRAQLLNDNIELDAKATSLAASIETAGVEVTNLTKSEEEIRAQLAALEEDLRGLRQNAAVLSDKRQQAEVELVRKQSDMKHLEEMCQKELGMAVAELAAGDEAVLDETQLAEAEEKYTEVRRKIEALGPVNPDALAEFEESQQRYDFLNAQRQDLLDSIRDTEKAIQEIDTESKKRFQEAFDKINEYFRGTYQILFSGGSGEMRLTDPTNVNESGIDIIASPPGKRLQNVLLLSGGERAMTAMALLMAIFKFQPSPFCVLDEVDAPLDEANIIRLTKLVKEMSNNTQFIFITHAKRTMEASSSMYGVTMQEPGVSKLVSVKFNGGADRPSTPIPPPSQDMAVTA